MQAKELARHVRVAVVEDLTGLARHHLFRSTAEPGELDAPVVFQPEDDSALLSELAVSVEQLAYLV